MSEQNSSAFFMHNFALRSSLAAKSEMVKTLRGEIRDFFGKINEYKSNYSETAVRKLLRNTYRLKKSFSGVELAEMLWPALKNFLEAEIDFDQDYSEFEKKAFLIIILERANKFFNFEFLPKDTSYQIFSFYSLLLPHFASLVKEFFCEELNGIEEINSFMISKLNYSMNLTPLSHLNPEIEEGTVQEIKEQLNEIKLFIPIKKVKILDEVYKPLSMLFNKDFDLLKSKVENFLYRSNDFSLLTNSSNISGASVINASFYSYIEKNSFCDSHETFRTLIQSFEAALFLVDELNKEAEDINDKLTDMKYELKDQVQSLKSDDLWDMFFNPEDFVAEILVSTVTEFAENAGVNIEILKSSLAESKLDSRDFFTSVNSILICSCSYFDCEQLKQSFFNKVSDYIRVNFAEAPEIDHKGRQIIALAALTYSRPGVDLILSLMTDEDSKNNFLTELDLDSLFEDSNNDKNQISSEQKSVEFFKHNMQFGIWKKAREVLSIVAESKNQFNDLEKSLASAALI
ncbi:MAG: hypothetical protein HRT47_11400 [Candidatus Caenarcaniphilales bacterium]|nr:hypothetical protein [Candidatus Caenarcaniphilales bacterium]